MSPVEHKAHLVLSCCSSPSGARVVRALCRRTGWTCGQARRCRSQRGQVEESQHHYSSPMSVNVSSPSEMIICQLISCCNEKRTLPQIHEETNRFATFHDWCSNTSFFVCLFFSLSDDFFKCLTKLHALEHASLLFLTWPAYFKVYNSVCLQNLDENFETLWKITTLEQKVRDDMQNDVFFMVSLLMLFLL